MNKFAAGLIFLLPFPAAADVLLFLQAPPLEVVQDSAVALNLASSPGSTVALDSCGVYASPVPLGSVWSGHQALSQVADSVLSQPPSLRLDFTPSAGASGAQLALGVHYLIAACQDGADLSPEFPLRVVTHTAPVILTPQAQATSTRPEISWSPVPGVPAYHLLLSDQPLQINAQAGTVSGASVIWQAIVSDDHILYGDPDPSGNFSQIEAPPLTPGVQYNLAILNNYDGSSPLNTSTQAEALKFFTYNPSGSELTPPRLLAPAVGTAFAAPRDSLIVFRWTTSTAAGQTANTYQLYVYASASENGIELLRPVWQTVTTDTAATLAVATVLLPGRYVYKVFAQSSGSVSGSVSDTASFSYTASVQTLQLGARTVAAPGDTALMANVRVTVSALNGSNVSLPFYTLSTGLVDAEFAWGQYQVAFAADGYDPVILTAVLNGSAAVTLDPVLSASRGRISGTVVDTLSRPLGNVTVTAVGSDGAPVTAQSDAQGNFLLGIQPGAVRLVFSKDDYAETDTSLMLADGQSEALGTVVLRPAAALLSGLVRTPAGVAIPSADVEVTDSAGAPLRSLLTDGQGDFSLSLPRGNYQVAVSRTGYAGQTQPVALRAAVNLIFTLTPGASVINVQVTQVTRLPGGDSAVADLPAAALTLRPVAGGTAVTTGVSDVNGTASLSAADTGRYWLTGSQAQDYQDSVIVWVVQAKSTVSAQLRLLRYASVSGHLALVPDTAADPARIQIALLPTGSSIAAATGSPVSAPLPDTSGRFAFTLNRIPAGAYHVTCGLPGYALDSEPVVTMTAGLSVDTLQLTLRKTTSQAAFEFRHGNAVLPGTVFLRTPYATAFPADAKQTLGGGAVVIDGVPQDTLALPLRGYALNLPGTAGLDTTIDLPFPVWRDPGVAVRNGSVFLPYRLDTAADAGSVAYSSGAGTWDTLRLASTQLRAGADTVSFAIPPQGGSLQYALDFRFGAREYGQGAAGTPYRVTVPRDTSLTELTSAQGDTLLLPANAVSLLAFHAWSAAGDNLDAGVLRIGKVTVRLSSGFSGSIASVQGLTASLRADAPPASKAAIGVDSTWDTLTVTVTYEGTTASLPVRVRAVRQTINRLALTSQAGGGSRLTSPQTVPLLVTAFDTTTSPPTSLAADPEFTVDPPEAGVVTGGSLLLDSAFIGPVRVTAQQTGAGGTLLEAALFPNSDSLQSGINVGQTLRPGSGGRFHYTRAVEVICPDSAFPQGALLRLFPHELSRTFSSLPTASLQGPAYELSNPNAAPLADSLEIRIAPPSGVIASAVIRRFDPALLQWFDLADTGSGPANAYGLPYASAQVSGLDGQYYGLFTASQSLGVTGFEVIPNPFSPRVTAVRDGNTQPGARILFTPDADSSSEVTVTLRIYNQAYACVRTLVNYKTYPKSPSAVYWDGLDDSGRRVRDGRYLLSAVLTPTGGGKTRYMVKPIVVFE